MATADEDKKAQTLELTKFIYDQIVRGHKISDAVRATGAAAFPSYVPGTLKAAEESGRLDDALDFLANIESKERKLKKRIRQALSYPLIIAVVTGVIFFVLAWFLQGLTEVFRGIGATIPVYLQFLINISKLVFSPWLYFVLGLIILSCYQAFKRPSFRTKVRRASQKIGLPIFSRIMVLSANIHFCRLLAMQLETGCPLLPALSRALKGTDDSKLISQADSKSRGTIVWKIVNGIELHQALEKSGYFSAHLVSMLRVAEESGSIPRTLLAVADFLQSELDYRFEQFTALVQPIFIITLGSVVTLIAVGTFVPLLEVMNI